MPRDARRRHLAALREVFDSMPPGEWPKGPAVGWVELFARLDETKALLTKAQSTVDVGERAALLTKSAAVLTAMPRAELDAAVSDLQTKAHQTGDPVLKRGYLEQAEVLKAQNPQPPEEGLAAARGVLEKADRRRRRGGVSTSVVRPAGPGAWVREELPRDPVDGAPMLYKAAGAGVTGSEIRRVVAAEVARVRRQYAARIAALEEQAALLKTQQADLTKAAGGSFGRPMAKPQRSSSPTAAEQAAEFRRKAVEVTDPALREAYLQRATDMERKA